MVHSNHRRDGGPFILIVPRPQTQLQRVLQPIQTNRFAPWPGAQLPASLQQGDVIIAREFSNTRGQEMIAPRRSTIK